jgi:hypothetical protein
LLETVLGIILTDVAVRRGEKFVPWEAGLPKAGYA